MCSVRTQWAKICFFVKSISRKFREIDFTKIVLAHSAILSWWMLWKKYFPPPKWLRTRTSKWLTKVRIVKIIKMSMQKRKIMPKKFMNQDGEEKKRDLHYYSIYLKKLTGFTLYVPLIFLNANKWYKFSYSTFQLFVGS